MFLQYGGTSVFYRFIPASGKNSGNCLGKSSDNGSGNSLSNSSDNGSDESLGKSSDECSYKSSGKGSDEGSYKSSGKGLNEGFYKSSDNGFGKGSGINFDGELGEDCAKNLLVLHGWGAQHTVLAAVYSALCDRYNIIVLDFPPFGMSGQLCRPLDMLDYARLTVKVLESLAIAKCDILCHSFGARVAALLCGGNVAKDAGITVDRLIITGGAGLKPRFNIRRWAKKVIYKAHKRLAAWKVLPERGLLRYFSKDYKALPEGARETFKNIVSHDLLPYFALTTQKTLLIYGKRDKDTPPYMARRLKKVMRSAGLIILKGCGHYCFLQKTDTFIAHVNGFLC